MLQNQHTCTQDRLVSLGLISQSVSGDNPDNGYLLESEKPTLKTVKMHLEKLPTVLLDHSTGSWSPAVIFDAPEGEKWQSQQIFTVCIEDMAKLDAIKTLLTEYGLDCSLIYTTAASEDDHAKSFVVWILDEPITNLEDRDALTEAIHHLVQGIHDSEISPSATLPPASEILYQNLEKLISAERLLVVGHLAYIAKGAPTNRTISRRINEVAKNCTSYNIIESVQKKDTDTPIRRVNYRSARKIKILDRFLNGQRLTLWELFGLATNLAPVSGGLAMMDRTMQTTGVYSPIDFAVIPYVRKIKFIAFELKSYSPFSEDRVYRDVLQAEKFQDRRIVRKKPYKSITLSEGEKKLAKIITDIQNSYDNKIHVIKAAAGLGKTERYLDWEGATIALPNHHIINEVHARMRTWCECTLPIPKLLNEENRKKLERYLNMGSRRKVRELLQEIRDTVPFFLYTLDPDQLNADDYLYFMKKSHSTDETLLTTHNTALSINNKNKTYIFDEDPLTTSLLQTEKVFLSDLRELLRTVENRQDRKLVQDVYDHAIDATPNKIYENAMCAYSDYGALEELVATNEKLQGSILNFLNAASFVVSPKNQDELNFITKRSLPTNKQVLILSATVDEWVYRQLYGDRVEFYDISNVVHVGEILQDSTYTFSRSNLDRQDVLDYAQRAAEDRIVITFKELAQEFSNGSSDVYFFKSQGFDKYKGKEIAVVGTPHRDISSYLLYADALGLRFTPRDFAMYERVVERNGMEFKIYSFENQQLRNLQLYLIESDLRQAGGRARTLREPGGSVLFLTNFGLPEAKQMHE